MNPLFLDPKWSDSLTAAPAAANARFVLKLALCAMRSGECLDESCARIERLQCSATHLARAHAANLALRSEARVKGDEERMNVKERMIDG